MPMIYRNTTNACRGGSCACLYNLWGLFNEVMFDNKTGKFDAASKASFAPDARNVSPDRANADFNPRRNFLIVQSFRTAPNL